MSEPSGSLLFTAHQCDPFITAPTEPFPYIRISIHPSRFLRLLEGASGRSTNTMSEALVVPESAVLQYQPPSRFADSTPAFALVPMTAHPARGVEITIEAKFLLMGDKIRVAWIHVFRWRWHLLLVERGVKIRRIT